jgi:hypothetical protein
MPAIVACGFLMDRRMIRMHNAPPFVLDQLAFVDSASLIVFPALVILSICYARNLQLHARYIVCTVLLLLPPALTRALFFVPSMRSFQTNVNISEAMAILVLLMLILSEMGRGRLRAPYPLVSLVFIGLAVASNYAKNWAWWQGLSGWIAGGRT